MAEESEMMRRSVFLVASALTKFARSRGWKDSDYWIYYKTNPEWNKVHFIFVVEEFKDQDLNAATKAVWDFLMKELSVHQDVLNSLGLVVLSKAKVQEGGLYAIGPGYEEYFGPGYKEFWTIFPVQKN